MQRSWHEDSRGPPVHGAKKHPEMPGNNYFSSFGQLWVIQPPPPYTNRTGRIMGIDENAHWTAHLWAPDSILKTSEKIFVFLWTSTEHIRTSWDDLRTSWEHLRTHHAYFSSAEKDFKHSCQQTDKNGYLRPGKFLDHLTVKKERATQSQKH